CMRVQNLSAKHRARKSCKSLAVEKLFLCAIFRFSNAGQKTAGVSLPCQMCTRAIRRQTHATSAFTGCKCMTRTRPQCIGNFIRWARATANVTTNAVNACQSRSHSVATLFTHSRQLHRCRTDWTNCSLLASCERNQSNLFAV